MSKSAKKFAKKKEREREVHKKIVARRQANMEQAKEKRHWEKEDRDNRPRSRPIFNSDVVEAEKVRQQEVRLALEHNLEILKALEDEYLASLKQEERKPKHVTTATMEVVRAAK